MMLVYPRTLLLITSLFLLVGGSETIADNKSVVIDVDRTVERGGLRHEVNKETPFTGKVVSYHENGQQELEGIYKDVKLVGK